MPSSPILCNTEPGNTFEIPIFKRDALGFHGQHGEGWSRGHGRGAITTTSFLEGDPRTMGEEVYRAGDLKV